MSARADLHDPALPALTMLLGEGAAGLFTAVFDEAGGRVKKQAISQVRYVPARSVTVQYRVDVVWESGKPTRETMVATSGIDVPPDIPVFAADGVEIATWRFPNDPFLPGLATVYEPVGVAALLDQLGAPTEAAQVRTRAYRAGRRAVLEVTTPTAQVFMKVVRPSHVARLQRTHTSLAAHVPVPHSLGWSEEKGILALQALPGRTLRKALELQSRQVPTPSSLLALLDRFPPTDSDSVSVAGPRARVDDHGRLVAAVLPALAARLDEIVGRLQLAGRPGSDPVHGDFHSSQILTRGSDVVGLVDVDTSGAGHRVDDLASLLGQLSTLSLASRGRRNIDRYGAALISAFDSTVDPVELRLCTAAVVFGLATGPFRVQLPRWEADTERRVALAEGWIESADEVSSQDSL